MIDRPRFDAALSLIRASAAASPPAERDEMIGTMIALVSVMLMDQLGVAGAAARLRREADEIEEDYRPSRPERVN